MPFHEFSDLSYKNYKNLNQHLLPQQQKFSSNLGIVAYRYFWYTHGSVNTGSELPSCVFLQTWDREVVKGVGFGGKGLMQNQTRVGVSQLSARNLYV
jgi:hypothetical protein